LGKVAKDEYIKLRESYKGQGLTPKEAIERAYVELKVESRWHDWKRRKAMRTAMGEGVPLTEAEVKGVSRPGYAPLKVGDVEAVGDQEMSPAEQVKWAMDMAARVQSKAAEPPTRFPCSGALFWYQSAVQNRQEFQKVVLRVDAPGGDPDNLYLMDSQHQYSEIEKNLRECLEEVGDRILELAQEWKEKRGGEQSVGEV
jgi:hypothetical protein